MSRVRVAVAIGIVAVGWLATAAPARAAGVKSSGEPVVVAEDFKTPINGGGSTTPFSLNLPNGAACQGDSTNGNYRVQSFIVPALADPGTFRYEDLRPQTERGRVLYATTSHGFWNSFTDKADTKSGPGKIIGIPAFNFKVFTPDLLPAGRYHIGIACSLFAQTTRYWSTDITIARDAKDSPAQIKWTVVHPGSAPGSSVGRYLAFAALAALAVVIVGTLVTRESRADAVEPQQVAA